MSSEAKAWIETHGSGSLRRAYEEDLQWNHMYVHERLAYEVATSACAVSLSHIDLKQAKAYPDDPVTTESCWYARVLRFRLKQYLSFDDVKVRSFMLKSGTESMSQLEVLGWPYPSGVCLHLEGLKMDWLNLDDTGLNYLILLPVSFWDEHERKYTEVVNPC